MTKEEYEVYSNALSKWGAKSQIDMLFEEMAELQNAICKFGRKRNTLQDVVTEIADVQIMAEQMAILFGMDNVKEEKKRKLERLKRRIGDYCNVNNQLKNSVYNEVRML